MQRFRHYIALAAAMIVSALALSTSSSASGDLAGVSHVGKARQNWILQCQGCHRADASGTAETTPAMNGMLAKFLWVEGGREYLIRVPGVSTAPLSDKALASLMNWTLWTFDAEHLPEDFKPYDAKEVGSLRRKPLRLNTDEKRAALITKIETMQP
jgi:hypothetical protein